MHTSNERPTETVYLLGHVCACTCEAYVTPILPPPPISALAEKCRLVNKKCFAFPSLQRQNQLLLGNKQSGGHLIGHVNTHNVHIWSLENPHEVLESQQDSLKLNAFVPNGNFVFGELTLTGSAYLDALQLWLVPQLKENEPDNFIWQQEGAPPQWHLSLCDWLNITVLDQWIFRKGPHDKACFA
ncbi:uncharacterized protein TNCV_1706941 [Trichonephila clavipes]|uniref:Uncharacterized protein n=1 Tax=Trichonephila clavipes TaxID=2585209 RepID=A0A8X6V2P6_TRICX|nr:uncharacterized protein TNCV_1706941 [Trichonephila clavipes]